MHVELIIIYWEGVGVKKDIEKAVYWTQKAAIHGDRDAQYNLAIMNEEKLFSGASIESAIDWYKRAAEQEHDLAIERLKELGLSNN